MRFFLIYCLVLLSNFTNNFAQTWSPLSMYGGGYIIDVVPHPTDANTLYAVCDVAGVFKTTDGCQTWQNATANIPKTTTNNFQTRSLLLKPGAPNTVYMVTGNAPYEGSSRFWKSTDAATTWTSYASPVAIGGNGTARYGGNVLAINPNNPSQIFLAGQATFNYGTGLWNTDSGLYRSDNEGVSWTALSATLGQAWITGIRFKPLSNNILYISAIRNTDPTNQAQAEGFYSFDITNNTLTQLSSDPVTDFDFDAGDANKIITTSNAGNRISTDGGQNWSAFVKPFGLNYDIFCTAHPTEAGHWFWGSYAFNSNSIVETTDFGATYKQVKYENGTTNGNLLTYPSYLNNNYKPGFANYAADLYFSPANSSVCYTSDWYGVWKSTNASGNLANGTNAATNANWSWSFLAQGIYNLVQLRASVKDNTTFYANIADLAYYESSNAGASMNYTNGSSLLQNSSKTVFAKNNPSIGYLAGCTGHGNGGRLFRTTNGGANWTALTASVLNSPNIYNIVDMQISNNTGDTITIGVVSGTGIGIYRSTNAGVTWAAYNQGLASNGYFDTWQKYDKLLKDADNQTYYTFYENNLYARKDGDAAWVKRTNPATAGDWFGGIATYPTLPKTLFATQYNGNMYKSTNAGVTWTMLSAPPCVACELLAISPNGRIAISESADYNANRVQNTWISDDNGLTFNNLGLSGFYAMLEGMTFVGNNKLVAWSGSTGGYTANLSPLVVLDLPLENFIVEEKNCHRQFQAYFSTTAKGVLELEKSLDGQNFTTIATQKMTKQTRYFFSDDEKNTAYYRLKMIENDSRFTYSKTLTSKTDFDCENEIKIFPNPIHSGEKLQIEGLQNIDIEQLTIIDALGKTIFSTKNPSTDFTLPTLPKGLFSLQIKTSKGFFVKKIIVE